MKLNNNFTLEHKNGYWLVGVMKTTEEAGRVYKAQTKTYPTLEKATLFLEDNQVDKALVDEVAAKVYNEYQLEQSRLFFVDKERNQRRKESKNAAED
jgi:hypothetical protein